MEFLRRLVRRNRVPVLSPEEIALQQRYADVNDELHAISAGLSGADAELKDGYYRVFEIKTARGLHPDEFVPKDELYVVDRQYDNSGHQSFYAFQRRAEALTGFQAILDAVKAPEAKIYFGALETDDIDLLPGRFLVIEIPRKS